MRTEDQKELKRARSRAYMVLYRARFTPAQKEKQREYHRAAQAKYLQTDRGYAVQKAAEARYWKSETGRAVMSRSVHRRRLLIQGTPIDGIITAREIKELRAAYTTCAYCLIPLSLRARHLDHVIPISKGGMHTQDNIVVCCQRCNSSKGTRGLIQWLALQGGHPLIKQQQGKELP